MMSSTQRASDGQGTRERLVNLDLLRGIAALMVCLSHAPFFLDETWQVVSWLAIPALGVGVDLFFAISGFVIAQSLHDLHEQSGEFWRAVLVFYLRRFGRIVPLLWFVVIVIGIVAIGLPRSSLPWADLMSAAAFTANMNFGWCFAGAAGCGSANLLHHTWSLALEMQYYLVAPLLFLIPVRVLRALTIIILFVSLFVQRPWQASLGWAFQIEALLLGFWIGREWSARFAWRWPRSVPALSVIELVGLLTVMALLPRVMAGALSGMAIVSVAMIAGWIVVRTALSPALFTNGVAARIGQGLGAWSYAIYLVHPPIMIAIGLSGLVQPFGFGAALAVSMAVVLVMAGWLTRTIGDPAYRATRRFTDRHLLRERAP
jgi:peptidoglycan/LPS O-acetylase OafA/YrhL